MCVDGPKKHPIYAFRRSASALSLAHLDIQFHQFIVHGDDRKGDFDPQTTWWNNAALRAKIYSDASKLPCRLQTSNLIA